MSAGKGSNTLHVPVQRLSSRIWMKNKCKKNLYYNSIQKLYSVTVLAISDGRVLRLFFLVLSIRLHTVFPIYPLLYLWPAREHRSSHTYPRSFQSACPWLSWCLYAEGYQQVREMPSKITFETEDQTMEEVIETVAEAKSLKVSKISRVAGNGLNSPCGSGDVPSLLPHVWQHVAERANPIPRLTG